MDPKTAQILLGAAGSGGAAAATYVDDVFSTYLWEGDGGYNLTPAAATVAVDNGIDLSGEGGLVWLKNRDDAYKHWLFDTERGGQYSMNSNTTAAEADGSSTNRDVTFNSTGFVIGEDDSGGGLNRRGEDHVSWTFRKAPGFFDVVTYSGDSSSGTRTISHNLGSVPGMIIVKRRDSADSWMVYHRSLGNTKGIKLDATVAAYTAGDWGNTTPTSTQFTVNANDPAFNASGGTYVAYLFAHDDQSFGTDSDEAIIKCGSWTGNSVAGTLIDVGFEPQWILFRRYNSTADWELYDVMRSMDTENATRFDINEASAESDIEDPIFIPRPTGFTVESAGGAFNQSGGEYIYIAIRRPNKPPEAATDAFAIDTFAGTSPTPPEFVSGFPVDAGWFFDKTSSNGIRFLSRLTGHKALTPTNTNQQFNQFTLASNNWDFNNGWYDGTSTDSNIISYMFKRTSGFFDVVVYDGTGSLNGVDHNLGVSPELKIIKRRRNTSDWIIGGSVVNGANGYIYFDASAMVTSSGYWDGGVDSATKFSVRNAHNGSDQNGAKYIAYLFATLDGVSKVGTYTGTGAAQNIDCGFTSGARFVLIRVKDDTGNWYVFDTTRGIVAGNDPYIDLRNAAAQVTNLDLVDPYSGGFALTSNHRVNQSTKNYLFLAIA